MCIIAKKKVNSCKKTCCCFSCSWKELQFSQLHDLQEAIPSSWYDLIFGSKAIPICTLEIVPTLALQLCSFVEFYLLSEPHPSYQVLPLCYCCILSLKMLRQSQHLSNEGDLTGDLPPSPFSIRLNIYMFIFKCPDFMRGRWWTLTSWAKLIYQAFKEAASLWNNQRNWMYVKDVLYLSFLNLRKFRRTEMLSLRSSRRRSFLHFINMWSLDPAFTWTFWW